VRFASSDHLCRLVFGVPRPVRSGLAARTFKIVRFHRYKVKKVRSRGSGLVWVTKMLTLR
jgi:hypothetical protein